jgi:hypothetical protein
MKRCIAFMCATLTALIIGSAALADEAALDATEYIFKDENVMGELVGNEGVSVMVRPKGPDRSLIKVRSHFVKEMLKSVETM